MRAYSFMPKGIISRLIVRLHAMIDNEIVWDKGVLLKNKKCIAEVIEEDNYISIYVNGDNDEKKYFMSSIKKEIQSIHNDKRFANNISVKEMIPCNCDDCAGNTTPTYFDYLELKELKEENIATTHCRNGRTKVVYVLKLMEGVAWEYEDNPTIIYKTVVHGSVGVMGAKNKIKNINLNSDSIIQKIKTKNSKLKSLLKEFRKEANIIADNLSEEEKKEFIEYVNKFIEDTQKNADELKKDSETDEKNKFFNFNLNTLSNFVVAGDKLSDYIRKILDAI